MTKYFVYALCDPRKPGKFQYGNFNYIFDYEPYYIGKGTKNRINVHFTPYGFTHSFNNIKKSKITNIINSGFKPKEFIIILKNELEEKESFEFEKFLISNIGRLNLKNGPLSNLTDGEEGCSGLDRNAKGKTYEERYGIEVAAQMKEKKSKRMKGINPQSNLSEKRKLEIREASIKATSKPILQYSIDNEFIQEWSSITEAARSINTHTSFLWKKLKDNKPCKGFNWTYKK